MKVVLFCGGKGLRLRGEFPKIPKPMVRIGSRPILWYVMKYYAHFGHKEFILCLGHQGDVIKNAFLNHQEFLSNDFMLSEGGNRLELLTSDVSDWKITFVNTGGNTCIGERLVAMRPHLEGDDVFLANYADCVTDLYLPDMLDRFLDTDMVGCCLSIPPNYTFHVIESDDSGSVKSITAAKQSGLWINGGYFVLRKEIFDYMEEGEDLVEEPFQRLAQEGKLSSFNYDGFWACMDTFKEKMILDEIHAIGRAPWEVWNHKATDRKLGKGKIFTL